MEKRLLLAFVLSAAILLAWSVIFPPPPRQQPPTPQPTPESRTVEETDAVEEAATAEPDEPIAEDPEEAIVEAVGGVAEERVEIRNDFIEVALTNRGAAVASYRLSAYDGDGGQPLDLVQAVPLSEATLPLQLITPDGPDEALYAIERIADGVRFLWSDGRLSLIHISEPTRPSP